KALRDSGLCDASGLIPADLMTLRTAAPNVFAVGDVALLKLADGRVHPKAGTFAEGQARAVAQEIAAKLGIKDAEPYNGRGSCYFDAGHGLATEGTIDLFAQGGPKAQMAKPSKEGLEAKKRFEAERL